MEAEGESERGGDDLSRRGGVSSSTLDQSRGHELHTFKHAAVYSKEFTRSKVKECGGGGKKGGDDSRKLGRSEKSREGRKRGSDGASTERTHDLSDPVMAAPLSVVTPYD